MTAPSYHCNGAPATRETFYAVACDPRRSVVVEACAGAGKTWMLVARIVRALLDGTPPHAILAITFTRKAAGEMRERLHGVLRELADAGDDARVQMLVERGLAPAAARAAAPQAATLLDRVLAGGRDVDVRTFHAWFAQLLRAAPLDLLRELGFAPQMALVEELDDLRGELFARFHARVIADAALHHDYRDLVARRGRGAVRDWLEAAWQRRIEIELADEAGTLDDAVPPAGDLWPRFAGLVQPAQVLQAPAERARWLALARELAALGKAKPRDAAAAIERALAQPDALATYDGLRRALFTDKGEPRKQLGDGAALRAAIDDLEALAQAVAQHDAHVEHKAMARLARVLLAEYAALKRRQGLVDMADLELVARQLLADPVLSGWVQERLDARVRHLLIDEFQDTSPLQWHALRSWLEGYAGAGGGAAPPAVFIVGDPKQSIYRFRRAEPRVFAAARDFVVDALGGDVLACDHTRRNHPAVLAVVNAVFTRARDDGEYVGFREHTTHVAGDPAAVALHRLERIARDDAAPAGRVAAPRAEATAWRPSLHVPRRDAEEHRREREARQVALAVQALVAGGVAPGEIQVLARKRDALRRTAAALQALHVPFAAPEESALADQPEARDLVAVLDVLASPGHDLSLAHALKSPLFDAGDDELALVAHAARDAAPCTWWDALMALSAPTPALARARALLAAWADAAAVLPPHDLLERIVTDGDLWPRLAARVGAERWPAARQAVRTLLALALELDGGRYATPYRFVRALRRRALKVAAEAQPDAVQLLTVHGAKGLEARVVVLVDGDPEAQRTPTATLLVDWPVDAAQPRRVAFVASEARCPPSLRELLAAEQAQREREELNMLYVALTRAQERLVVSATEPHRGTPRSWWQRLQGLAAPLELAAASAPAAAAARDIEVSLRPRPVLAPAPEPPPAAADDVAARLGQAVHRLLEWATAPGAAGFDVGAAAEAAARAFGLPPALAHEVRERAQAVLGSAQAARFFAPGLRWAGNEVTVADAEGVARIDRLVCLEGDGAPEWWVLDYKLAHAPAEVEGLRAQLARYRAAVQALQPGERVRAAFITGRGEVLEI
ncbi:UvrD-helicase domain-containing protein [Calidifontimicrobium sp. SYSU G02091]|uniref:UvrD-helicase domain-containing protein n=1 Tax=Calidifontimicrobium sp. SYSU G02091 TaxID=2926421 RepID=UPI001F53702C|nr:UvrD-helicase domain-containing protein [Calidifontimicrobium sp. SYSU G02091]MCI1192756.1 UvrD-helicase domain-containing protein [Calidifontimicrobium sp. SYSU G02091]